MDDFDSLLLSIPLQTNISNDIDYDSLNFEDEQYDSDHFIDDSVDTFESVESVDINGFIPETGESELEEELTDEFKLNQLEYVLEQMVLNGELELRYDEFCEKFYVGAN